MKNKYMNNKLFALSLSALTLLSLITLPKPVVAQTSDGSTSYYENNFDNDTTTSLLENWTVTLGTGSASIDNGALTLSGPDTIPTTIVYNNKLPAVNYKIEFDFSFDSYVNNTRWGGFVVDYIDGAGLWHASLRKNGNLNIDYYDSVNNSYPIINSFTRSEGSLNEVVRVKINYVNNIVAYYVNGAYVAHLTIDGNQTQNVGFACRGAAIWIDNLKITSASENDLPVFKSTDVYVPETGFVNAPVVVNTPTSVLEANYNVNGERPSVSIINVDSELNALNNGEVFSNAGELANTWQKGVIPAFRVEDESSANAAAEFFYENDYIDSFIVVNKENASLLKQARSKAIYTRGIIDFSNDKDVSVSEITSTIYENSASVAIVPFDYSSENIERLRARLVTVWKYAEEDTYLSAVYSGVNGIVTSDYASLYNLYKGQKDRLITRKTLVSGHRGMSGSYPENTINGFLKAYKTGVDMFELDVYVTTDNELVIHHDSTVDRTTNGTGNIESKTLAEVKALTIDTHTGISETIPTLREVYETFKNKDVVLQVELKSGKEELVPFITELTEEMEMMNQVAFFSSNFVQMKKVREYMPKAPAGVFIHTALTGNVSDYEKLQLQTTLYNYQTSHEFSNIDSDLDYAYKLSARGMTSFIHTVNLETNFDDFVYNSGVDCLLTDYPEWGNKYIYNISAITSNVELGTPFTPKAKVNGTYKVVTCGIENVDGTAIEVDGDGKYCLLEEIEVVYYYDFSKIVNYGTYKEEIKYRLYSQPVVIK